MACKRYVRCSARERDRLLQIQKESRQSQQGRCSFGSYTGDVYKRQVSTSGKLVIVVEDKGVGIEDVEKAMEPMFSTAKDEERSGMGFTVMESFTDRLAVRSETGKGTTRCV